MAVFIHWTNKFRMPNFLPFDVYHLKISGENPGLAVSYRSVACWMGLDWLSVQLGLGGGGLMESQLHCKICIKSAGLHELFEGAIGQRFPELF